MRPPAPTRLLALTALTLSMVTACSSDGIEVTRSESVPTSDTSTTTTDATATSVVDGSTVETSAPVSTAEPQPYDGEIVWTGELEPGLEEGWLTVPIDYTDHDKGTIDLYVVRHLADPGSRIGSLLVNPGGPGFGGSVLALAADRIYGDDLLRSFDIVGWDPRGTGLSEMAIDCIDDYDRYFAGTDITPDDDVERQQIVDLAEEFATECVDRNATLLPHVGTNNSARDMDTLRRALGEETISYFGFSYGSELGAVWATLFPDTVRAAVLDGAADPDATLDEGGLQQAAGFETSIASFLAACNADPSCPVRGGGDAERVFDDLMATLDESPIPTVDGRPDLTRAMAITAVAYAMYDDSSWSELQWALDSAIDGDGSGLLALYDAYMQRRPDGTYDNSLEAFQAISCMDDTARPTVAEDDATAAEYLSIAPRFAPSTVGAYFCTFFPPAIDPRVEVTGVGAGPILVMGTTGDPATPLSSTEAMADALEDGRLVIVTADQHTGYGVNSCSVRVIDDFLLDPTDNAPADGTRCD